MNRTRDDVYMYDYPPTILRFSGLFRTPPLRHWVVVLAVIFRLVGHSNWMMCEQRLIGRPLGACGLNGENCLVVETSLANGNSCTELVNTPP